jgi:uncharacterized protein YbjT (DUF2867 family)
MNIAVTTPTGHVGSRVVQLLVQAGVRPIVLVRDPDRLDPDVRDHVEVERGDLSDPGFVADATEGIDALLWVVPEAFSAEDPLADMTRMGENAAAAIRANGVSRTVMISSIGAERKHGAGLIDGLARNEEALADTGTNVLILRCGYFFTNLDGVVEQLRSGVLTTNWAPDAPMAWVDPRDIGEVAAARLLSASWTGVEVQAIHGPADLTWTQVAETIGAAVGRDVRLQVETDDEVRDHLRGAGMPERVVEGMIGMTTGLRDGFTPEQDRSTLTTTPTPLSAWAFTNLRPLL